MSKRMIHVLQIIFQNLWRLKLGIERKIYSRREYFGSSPIKGWFYSSKYTFYYRSADVWVQQSQYICSEVIMIKTYSVHQKYCAKHMANGNRRWFPLNPSRYWDCFILVVVVFYVSLNDVRFIWCKLVVQNL